MRETHTRDDVDRYAVKMCVWKIEMEREAEKAEGTKWIDDRYTVCDGR